MKALAIAAGLGCAALSGAAFAKPAAAPQAATAPQAAAAPAGAANTAPTTAAAPTTTAPTSPLLAQDGAPAIAIDPKVGLPIDGRIGLQPQVTKNGEFAHWMHNDVLLPVITAICVLVLLLLAWVVFRFRRAANPVPSKTSHNTFIEVLWTLGPVVVLVLIAIPSIGLLQAQFKPAPAGAVTLKAIGNQWYWTYQYPDHGGIEITANMLKEKDQVSPGERARTDVDGPRLLAVDNRIVLPVGVPIRLITTSNDVIHSWAIPAFWMKLDAVPGRLNETSFTIEKPGLYFGQCSELCGARHGFMPIAVQAVSPAQFAAWIAAKGGKMPGAATPSAAVIPQPGAEGSAAEATQANAAEAVTGPADNAATPAQSSTSAQGATGNPAGPGNAGQ
ncbi:cytochrome c oxidase subunit II [Sphingomonas sanguinis]|uniref:Cytochrome c oxidase subunit 2 n=2 Tax=Sphingomonas TaxID=13687 RepID=A0A147J358_9SPHN|nr:cytochrome c oxidase subunit II [Sphingomonas sanguinis]KTW03031.1 cytochrome C oxidase subunit II [Sphingomonas sanguinis]